MTAPATTRRAGPFNGNDSATSFPFTFKVFAKEDIQVQLTDAAAVTTTLVLDSDYSVSVNADQDASPGGAITYPISGAPLATGEKLVALGALEYSQPTDLPSGGAYRAKVVEDAFDRTVFQIQQLAEENSRALTLPASAATANTTLPAPEADKVIGWNATADTLVNLDAGDIATIAAFGTARADVFTGDGTAVNFSLTSNPGALANLDVSVGGVAQLPTTDYTWSGTTLTFVSAPPNGVKVLARYFQALPQGTSDAASATFADTISSAAPYLKTVSDVINGLPVSILRFVDLSRHAAILAGTSTVDQSDRLQIAVNSGAVISFANVRKFTVNNNVDLPNASVTIRGDGGVINGTHGGYVFGQANRGNLFKMDGLTFTGNAAGFRYGGAAALYGTQLYEYEIERCKFLQSAGISALAFIGAREGLLRSNYFEGNDGAYFSYCVNAELAFNNWKNCGRGIYYDTGSEGLKVHGGTSLGCTTMLQVWQSAGVQVLGVMWDYNDTSVLINGCSEVVLANNYISGRNSAPAVKVTSSGAVRSKGVKIEGNHISSNDTMATANDCVLIEDTDYFEVASNQIFNWRTRGLKTGNGCTFGKIHHNEIIEKSSYGTNSIVTGTSDDTISVDDNTVVKAMSLTSTRQVSRNAGWVTENRGEATSGTGTTSFVIAHGLSMTPLKRDIRLQPTSVIQSGLRWWLSAVDATNITITTDVNITGAISMAWEAKIRA